MRHTLNLVITALLSVVLFLGYLSLLNLGGPATLALELIGFFVILALVTLGLSLYGTRFGSVLLLSAFFLYLVNLFLVWIVFSRFYITLVLLALVALLLVPKRFRKRTLEVEPYYEDGAVPEHSQVFDAPKPSFSPGKYVASKYGNTYHEPKSDWAKRIKPENQVWFQSEQEAKAKGYKPAH